MGNVVPLHEVAILYDSLHKTPKYSNNGYKMVRVTDIHRGYVNLDSAKYVDEITFQEFTKKYSPKVGDILFTRVGSYGNSCFVNRSLKFCLGQNTVCITPNTTIINPFYLYCCLNSPQLQHQIASFTGGASQPTISINNIQQLSIPVPPLPIQRKIAAILSSYDDLIENNTRRIKILEKMAQAIYREWFVYFRFPGHEGVRMVESEMGLIPEGWEVVKVPDAIIINPRIKLPKKGIKPFLSMGCLTENTMNVQTIEYREGNSGSKYQNGDTLFARITPCLENGKTVFIQFLSLKSDIGFGSTEFIVLRSKTLTPEFVYLLSRTDSFRDNAIKSMSGATGRQRVQEECFEKFYFAHPDRKTLTAFDEKMQPIFNSVYLLSKKNENLRHTRDLLLPKLISGELDVSELVIQISEIEA